MLALALVACAAAAPASAAEMQPGQWRFTQTTQAGGRASTKATTRCVSPAQAKEPTAYFQPRGAGCAVTSLTNFGSRITSTLRCTQGAATSEITYTLIFASATDLTISTLLTSGTASFTMTGQGKRVGECGASGRRSRGG
jgi:hypothetical protein